MRFRKFIYWSFTDSTNLDTIKFKKWCEISLPMNAWFFHTSASSPTYPDLQCHPWLPQRLTCLNKCMWWKNGLNSESCVSPHCHTCGTKTGTVLPPAYRCCVRAFLCNLDCTMIKSHNQFTSSVRKFCFLLVLFKYSASFTGCSSFYSKQTLLKIIYIHMKTIKVDRHITSTNLANVFEIRAIHQAGLGPTVHILWFRRLG